MINKTRLKRQILQIIFFEKCREESDRKNCLLVFNEGLRKVLKEETTARDFDAEAILMIKLVKIMRQEILNGIHFNFQAIFHPMPRKLLSLLYAA